MLLSLRLECYMKMAADLRGWWRQKREDVALQQREPTKLSFMIPSPVEDKDIKLSLDEEKAARAKQCTDGMLQGLKFDWELASKMQCRCSSLPRGGNWVVL